MRGLVERWLPRIALILGIVGALLGFLGAPELLTPRIRANITYGSLALIALGVAYTAYVFAKVAWWRSQEFVGRNRSYRLVPDCSLDDIERIADLASDMFGSSSTSLEETIRLHNLDRRIFSAIKNDDGQLCGYVCLIRLSQLGVKALERGDFDIQHVPAEYLRTDEKRRYPYVYVGAVCGTSNIAKQTAMMSLEAHLNFIRAKKIFARAATKDGLRVLARRDFRPVLGGEPRLGMLFVRDSFALP